MSLADQSQQWFPTSVQVTVHQARDLRAKGKNGSNDAYAIMHVAKDKFSTSVAEKTMAPVWKEEASFDLPLFHPGNVERCTLYVTIMHRAHVGLDKFLGQAVVNLLDLHDDKSRKKLDWIKLVDKSGKQDKERGEVLLNIQFMRNNLSASMFDLSMKDKPRSRISKLKDKVRGKKKDGFSDSASAIVPPVAQVLTDSEGEADAKSLTLSLGEKKKSKLKSLFKPKSNLQRNISQSMSTLGTLPEKNSSLSGSRLSGLNVDSPEVKKKFKFLGHKRTGSSDSKVSQGPFSLLSRSKQSNSDLNSVCINGSHVYTEDTEPKSESTLSLNSSDQGSVEDIRRRTSDISADSFQSVPVPSFRTTDGALLEQQHHQEEEERRQAEERRKAEEKQEEEEKYRAEAKRLQEEEEHRKQEEQERNRRFLEDEARRKKEREEEERRRQEEEKRMLEEAERQRLDEERRRAEEQKHQEEASMSDRLTSLFGMIRKKEDKKEEVQKEMTEDHLHTPFSNNDPVNPSPNPFEDISLTSKSPFSSNESPVDRQKSNLNPQTTSAMGFLNRTAKVSAVKPRLPESLDSEPSDCQTPTQLSPSPIDSVSTFSSVLSETPDTFLNLHSSLAPTSISPSRSPRGSTENLSTVGSEESEESGESSPTMTDQWRRTAPSPLYPIPESQTGGDPVRDINSSGHLERDGLQSDKPMSLPLPDYESLFPQKRHGIQGNTRWDHLIAEVNQKHRELPPVLLLGPEMSVDGPEEHGASPKSAISEESSVLKPYQSHFQDTKPVSIKKAPAPAPPKPDRSSFPLPDSSLKQSELLVGPNSFEVPVSEKTNARKVLSTSLAPSPPPRPSSQLAWETSVSDDQKKAETDAKKDTPTAKPRQRASGKEPTLPQESSLNSDTQTRSSLAESIKNKKDNFVEFDPFPSTDLLSKDPWAQAKETQKAADSLAANAQREMKPEDRGMTPDDLDEIFRRDKTTNSFAGLNGSDSNKTSPYSLKDDVSKQFSAAFQRKNSQKGKKSLPYATQSDNKASLSLQEPEYKEGTIPATKNQDFPQADEKMQSNSFRVEDPFGAPPFTAPSDLTSSQPEEPASQEESLSGDKSYLQSWVSPSDVQPVSTQNSKGGGLGLSARRPHPVRPLSSGDNQHPSNISAGKDMKILDFTPGRTKVADSVGPYTQLTQEELITLVVKQQTDLSIKDAKIVQLEEYIDNLLVRVIDEQPGILQSVKLPTQM